MTTSPHRQQPADHELKIERLDEHERMLLLGQDRDAFLAVVVDPPTPTEKLRAALKRHREVLG